MSRFACLGIRWEGLARNYHQLARRGLRGLEEDRVEKVGIRAEDFGRDLLGGGLEGSSEWTSVDRIGRALHQMALDEALEKDLSSIDFNLLE